jgi:hypothetical protein
MSQGCSGLMTWGETAPMTTPDFTLLYASDPVRFVDPDGVRALVPLARVCPA